MRVTWPLDARCILALGVLVRCRGERRFRRQIVPGTHDALLLWRGTAFALEAAALVWRATLVSFAAAVTVASAAPAAPAPAATAMLLAILPLILAFALTLTLAVLSLLELAGRRAALIGYERRGTGTGLHLGGRHVRHAGQRFALRAAIAMRRGMHIAAMLLIRAVAATAATPAPAASATLAVALAAIAMILAILAA
jgi:hypothetical protein